MSGRLPTECFEMASKDLCSAAVDHAQNDLLNAWRKKDIDGFLNILSSNECDPDFLYENDNYMRLLDSAAENGDVEFAEAIIKAGAQINQVNPVRSKAPIHFAAEAGQLNIIKILVARGADVNIRDSSGSTILHYMIKQKWPPGDSKYKKCLEYLLKIDNLNVNLTNRKGLTAIHMAAMQGSLEAVKMLLEKGSHLDLDSIRVGSARRTGRQEILNRFPELEKDLPPPRDIYDIKMDGDKLFSLLHDNHEDRFCEIFHEEMKDKSQKNLLKYSDGKYTFLQYCCEKKFSKAVKVLLEYNVDVNYAPNKSTRPILIACRKGDSETLRLLLGAKPDLSPNEDGENPLHVIVKYTDNSNDHFGCLQILLRRLRKSNLDINAQDLKGNTPLHYAVKYGGSKCVEELLKNGAYIGTLNKFKKPPLADMSSSTLGNYLDNCITATDVLDRGNNYVMKFNYNFLVPKNHSMNSELDDVKIPLTEDDDGTTLHQDESMPESQPLLYMAKDSHLRKLLVHPVLTSFILLKWQRVRIFYYVNLMFYVFFCFLLTVYILFGYRAIVSMDIGLVSTKDPNFNGSMKIAHDKYSGVVEPTSESITLSTTSRIDSDVTVHRNLSDTEETLVESSAVDFLRICLIIFLAILTLRELFQVVIHPKKYFLDPENWLEIVLLIVLAFVLFKDCSREFPKSSILGLWCPQFSALAILLSWFELVLLAGKHPLQSLHIEMFKTVSINFMKFLAWYVILIIAFALTFYTLFRGCGSECEESNPFVNPGLSIFKSIIMLTGEFEAGDIPFVTFIGTSHLIFIAFIFLIAIVLLNLLNGLAVTDTQTIRDDSYLYRCIALVKLISYIENMLLVESDPILCMKLNIFKCSGQKNSEINLNCFDYLAKRIVFFPSLLKDGVIYVLPNQRYKICFVDPKSFKEEEQLCYSRFYNYYLDPSTAKTAEKILTERMTQTENIAAEMDGLKKEMATYGDRIVEMEKKMESLEQSTKQNEKLLIQILAILSLNNANNEEKLAAQH